jgi:rhodanese-related sulfurtransferase
MIPNMNIQFLIQQQPTHKNPKDTTKIHENPISLSPTQNNSSSLKTLKISQKNISSHPKNFPNQSNIEKFGPEAFNKILTGENTVILDARENWEFVGGHIEKSIFCGEFQVNEDVQIWLNFLVHLLPKNVNILIVSGGGDEGKVVDFLDDLGFRNVVGCLGGGIEGWRNAGYGVTETRFGNVEDFGVEGFFGEDELGGDVGSPRDQKENIFLDLRDECEWLSDGVFPFSRLVELKNLRKSYFARISERCKKNGYGRNPVLNNNFYGYCDSGYKSLMALSY